MRKNVQFLLIVFTLCLSFPVMAGHPFTKVVDPDGTVRFISATPEPGSDTPTPKPRATAYTPKFEEESPYTTDQTSGVVTFDWRGSGIIVHGKINGVHEVEMLLDTGASLSFISRKIFDHLNIPNKDIQGPFLFLAADGPFFAYGAEVDSVNIGNLQEKKLSMMVLDYEQPDIDGILGQDFLSNFRYEINPESKEVTFHRIGVGDELFNGKPGIWWCRKYELLNESLAFWVKYSGLVKGTQYEKAAERMIEITRDQLNELNVDASRAAVPREFRQGDCARE